MTRLREGLLRWGPALVWMGLIFFLSSRPDLPHAGEPWLEMVLRKGAHIVEYMILGALLGRAIGGAGWRGVAVAAVLGAAYAASDEWHQTFVPGRKGNLWDVLLDSAAAFAGAWLYRRAARRRQASG